MSLRKTYGIGPGEQVPLAVANEQSTRDSEALKARESLAANAAAEAVAQALNAGSAKPKRQTGALRAPVRRGEG